MELSGVVLDLDALHHVLSAVLWQLGDLLFLFGDEGARKGASGWPGGLHIVEMVLQLVEVHLVDVDQLTVLDRLECLTRKRTTSIYLLLSMNSM